MITINAERLLRDLRMLADFGKFQSGVDRVAFSLPDIESRRWLEGRFREAGLGTRTDRYGNVLGEWPDAREAVLIGSHTDTVPKGGWLDGALGVIYALEVARTLRDADAARSVGVDVISFQDEEGTYLPCLGSKSFCGALEESEVERARNRDGDRLVDALERSADTGEPLRLKAGRHIGFLEAHIEQGPRLISSGKRVGIVSSFVGIRRMTIEASGRADHAGTTPMDMRRDAGALLFRFGAWVGESFRLLGGANSVWNIGNILFEPGAANVVPSRARLTLEFRDSSTVALDRMEDAAKERLRQLSGETGIQASLEVTARIPPIETDTRLSEALAWAARCNGSEAVAMSSGAGHDCMILAKRIPAAMMFIPSIDGRSHDVDENTDDDDIVFGCQVLAHAVDRLVAVERCAR